MSRARAAAPKAWARTGKGELFMQYTIDRIGEEIVICEDEHGGRIKLKAAELPEGAKEGDILKKASGEWLLDEEETMRRRQKMREKLKRLIE